MSAHHRQFTSSCLCDVRRGNSFAHEFLPRRANHSISGSPVAPPPAIAGPGDFGKCLSSRIACSFGLSPSAYALALILTFTSGCSYRAPGERFSAGYVFPEKQSSFTHCFVVKNTTERPVEFLRIEKSCTCASVELEKYRLARGETAKLTFRMDVNKSYMHRVAACVLKTDHPKFKDWPYTVEFVSVPFAVADPDVLNLGRWRADSTNPEADHAVTLDLFADSQIALSRADFTVPNELELKLSPRAAVRRLQPQGWNTTYELSIRLSPKGLQTVRESSQSGVVTRTIDLLSPGSKSRRWQYTVYWQTLDSLDVHPSYLVFGNVLDEGDDHSRSVTITSTTSETFRIVSINGDSGHVRMASTVDSAEDAGRHRVTFELRPDESVGQNRAGGSPRFASGTIHVRTTDRRKPNIEIPWTAMLEPSGRRDLTGPGVKSPAGSNGSTTARSLN